MKPLLSTVAGARAYLDAARQSAKRVAVVPTMGALHQGHLSLIRLALQHAEEVMLTVFVNPTQFGPNEDLDKYPRDLARDIELGTDAGATCVFAPSVEEMYVPGDKTRVIVSGLTAGFCGASRPTHFEGVTTVVAKLFNLAGPAVFVFGRKDYQQLRVLQRLAKDLLFPVEIIEGPIVREADGLALSSRNVFLSKEERSAAQAIPKALSAANLAYLSGERRVGILREMVVGALDRAGLTPDYVELAEPDELTRYADDIKLEGDCVIVVAAYAGSTRLLDNLVLGQDASPVALK